MHVSAFWPIDRSGPERYFSRAGRVLVAESETLLLVGSSLAGLGSKSESRIGPGASLHPGFPSDHRKQCRVKERCAARELLFCLMSSELSRDITISSTGGFTVITLIQQVRRFGLPLTLSLLLVALGSIPARSAPNDVSVTYEIVTAESRGTVQTGSISVQVRNGSGTGLRNVDLRLANPGPSWIEKGLFQFGSIPAGEVRVVTGLFAFDTSGPPRQWRVEFDDQAGAHRVVVLPAN